LPWKVFSTWLVDVVVPLQTQLEQSLSQSRMFLVANFPRPLT
jgi:hypothetical protein